MCMFSSRTCTVLSLMYNCWDIHMIFAHLDNERLNNATVEEIKMRSFEIVIPTMVTLTEKPGAYS